MLNKLTIRNFKAIQDMTIEFIPLTVLIGENSCGKSSILQAIDFLRSAASRDIHEYLREKEWKFDELKSKCNDGKKKPIEFVTTWDLLVKDKPETLEWTLSVDSNKEFIIKEKLIRKSDNKIIISYHNDGQENIPSSLGNLKIQSSALKYIAGTSKDTDEIDLLFFFLTDSTNFELLSPEKMRNGKRLPHIQNIGTGGEALALCLEKMNGAEKQQLNKTVSDLIGSNIEIITIDRGNKIDISVNFINDSNTISVDSLYASDGLLRIIAFVVISMERQFALLSTGDGDILATESGELLVANEGILKNGMILLDEIENGINPYITGKIVDLLRNLVEKTQRQVIVTTHSPVILNEFKPEEIIFLWKDTKGSVNSRKFFSTEEMREALSFLNPGEIWENYGKDKILTKLGIKNGG
jgi:predicted ATPase